MLWLSLFSFAYLLACWGLQMRCRCCIFASGMAKILAGIEEIVAGIWQIAAKIWFLVHRDAEAQRGLWGVKSVTLCTFISTTEAQRGGKEKKLWVSESLCTLNYHHRDTEAQRRGEYGKKKLWVSVYPNLHHRGTEAQRRGEYVTRRISLQLITL